MSMLMSTFTAHARRDDFPRSSRDSIKAVLSRIVRREVLGGHVDIESVRDIDKTLEIKASISLSYYPFRPDNLIAMYDSVRHRLPAAYAKHRLKIYSGKHLIDELVPSIYRPSDKRRRFTYRRTQPLVRRLSSPNRPSAGLYGRHIALWQSHGRYFDQRENQWRWQRSRLWETVEDLYTQSLSLIHI